MTPQEFQQARRAIETPLGAISHYETGDGPAALFVHGLPLCGYEWRDVVGALAGQRRCIVPDLMGLGYSEVPATQDVSFASQARMLVALLDALEIEAVDLVGNDTGGGIAQILAAEHPSRVRTLTLTNCEVHDLWPNALLAGFYKAVVAGEIAEAMRVMLGDAAFGQQQLGVLVYENAASFGADDIALYLAPLLATDKRRAQFGQLADWATNRAQLVAVASRLETSRIPSQVIWGDGDVVFDTAPSLDWLRAHLGGLRRVVTIPGGKLFWPEEHPRRLATLLAEFWAM